MEEKEFTPEDNLSPEEELNAENEMELLRLSLEYGAESFIEEDAPAEVVSMFLKQIREFEERFKDKANMITIRESIDGNINIIPSDDISELDLEDHIDQLLQEFLEQGILIDRPEHLSARAYYEFLTEDFLEQMVVDNRPEGFIAGYLYEDIYEDDPEFIVENARFEIEDVLDHRYTYRGIHLADTLLFTKEREITKALFIEAVKDWHSCIKSIDRVDIEPEDEIEDGNLYHVTFDVSYNIEDQTGKVDLVKGLGIITMVLERRVWVVKRFNIPGFKYG